MERPCMAAIPPCLLPIFIRCETFSLLGDGCTRGRRLNNGALSRMLIGSWQLAEPQGVVATTFQP